MLEGLLGRDGHWGFFNDLLVTTLHRAVTTKKRDGVAVLVSNDLDFQVARSTGKLHDENRRACADRLSETSYIPVKRREHTGHFTLDSLEGVLEVVLAFDLADTLTTATF